MISVPEVLNRLIRAGDQGLPLEQDAHVHEELELCRNWGFPVQVREGRAFLVLNEDILVPVLIETETPCISWDQLYVAGYFEIDSTNDEALRRARQGAHGILVYAERQSAGRGRKGRQWQSASRAGLYFTLVVRPTQALRSWPLLTHVASIALVDTLREISSASNAPLPIDIKWPNDVLLAGKKVAGILLETFQGQVSTPAAVVGVGVNVGSNCVPQDLQDSATSVSAECGRMVPRRRLLVRFLYHFQLGYNLFEDGQAERILERWKSYSSMWNGVSVWIIEGDRSRRAVTCGLSELGALKVRSASGDEDILMAGDVSLRPV